MSRAVADAAPGAGVACERPEGPADASAAACCCCCCCSAASSDGDEEEEAPPPSPPAAFFSLLLFFSVLLLASLDRMERSIVARASEGAEEGTRRQRRAVQRDPIEIEKEKKMPMPKRRRNLVSIQLFFSVFLSLSLFFLRSTLFQLTREGEVLSLPPRLAESACREKKREKERERREGR